MCISSYHCFILLACAYTVIIALSYLHVHIKLSLLYLTCMCISNYHCFILLFSWRHGPTWKSFPRRPHRIGNISAVYISYLGECRHIVQASWLLLGLLLASYCWKYDYWGNWTQSNANVLHYPMLIMYSEYIRINAKFRNSTAGILWQP